MRFISGFGLVALMSLSLAGVLAPASASADAGAVTGAARSGAGNQVSVKVSNRTAVSPDQSAAYRGAYHYRPPLPRHSLDACGRSHPAFGDADFSFHGYDDAHIPC
ncbi:MAG TPA: hypothetical protein VF503_31830 [Sphingobium sp.]|uniref:hypothetical protein n=1 Tax=Sphingobium sp. TaxID=1912891 RepID=UPI002ED21666